MGLCERLNGTRIVAARRCARKPIPYTTTDRQTDRQCVSLVTTLDLNNKGDMFVQLPCVTDDSGHNILHSMNPIQAIKRVVAPNITTTE